MLLRNIDFIKPFCKTLEDFFLLEKKIKQKYFELENTPRFKSLRKTLNELSLVKESQYTLSEDVISIGQKQEVSHTTLFKLNEITKCLRPWRVGPYSLYDIYIDTEWQSFFKWKRIWPFIKDTITNKVICDIGANNGYFLFRLLSEKPTFLIGLEPTKLFQSQHLLLSSFIQHDNLLNLPVGFQILEHIYSMFDLILCMGVLYHHPNPIELLQVIHQSLKPKGKLILETMAIDEEQSFALVPDKKYNGIRGVWFIPTPSCLINWLKKLNFREIQVLYNQPLSIQEQRVTDWSSEYSFKDRLNHQKTTTIEGYPIQNRLYVRCIK